MWFRASVNAIERVSSFVLRLETQHKAGSLRGTQVAIPMSRVDLADYLGLTVETVSRCLSPLKREDLIALPHPQIFEVIDRAALGKVACARNGLGHWIYNA